MRGHAFLGRRHEMRCQQPLVQRNVRLLVNCPHGRRERLAARSALVQAGARALALHLRSFANDAAMEADRTIRPAEFLEMLTGGFFVRKDRVCQVGSHGNVSKAQ